MQFSIAGMAVAIVLIGLIGAAARPSISAAEVDKIDAAAGSLAALLRLTHAESVRTGTPHGVIFDPAARAFSAVRADLASTPFVSEGPIYDPIAKQPLVWQVPTGVSLNPGAAPFEYAGGTSTNRLLFDAWGTPYRQAAGGNEQLSIARLGLSLGNHSRTVEVFPYTGRVTGG